MNKGHEMQQSQHAEAYDKRNEFNHYIGGSNPQYNQSQQQQVIFGYKPTQHQVVEPGANNKLLDTSHIRSQNDNSRIMQKQAFTYLPQSDSNNTTHIMHQASASHSFSIRDPIYEGNTPDRSKHPRSETLDSNGNIIRGRKIDSPQLVVVRELRDQEDNEEGTAGLIDEEGLLLAFNSGSDDNDLHHFQRNKERNSSENKKRNMFQVQRQMKAKSKSLENNNNCKQKKSKSQQRYNQQPKANADVKQLLLLENHQNSNPQKLNKQKKQNQVMKNTKSTREIRSSMGFNELLNQLDKDISLQQSHQHDFKNRTTHDLLKLELSGIRRQNSSGANLVLQNNNNNINKFQEKSQPKKSAKQKQLLQGKNLREEQSRSQERKPKKVKQVQQNNINIAQIPKSILKKPKPEQFIMKDQIFQYAINEITPDKNQNHQGINTTSFLHSEHGRNAIHNQSNYQQNGKTAKTQNMIVSNNINVLFSKIKVNGKSQIQSQQSNKNQRDQSSPDRQVKEFKTSQQMNINIDKLVRQNIKKMRSKEDEEKLLKMMTDDQLRKRKEQLDQKNSQVRKMNKEKTYRKTIPQTFSFNQINQQQQNLQQSQDMKVMSSDKLQRQFSGNNQKQFQDDKLTQIHQNILQREIFMQKTSQTQKIDFNKIKEVKGKNLRVKNHRKSYGLEFIDIKKEIQEELRTIDLKYKNQNHLNGINKIIEEEDTNHMIFKDFDQAMPPQRLKIKSQKKIATYKDENYPIISVPGEQFISERIQPVNKIIVIKKNKIRKFMKEKKKFIIIQKIKEQKDEIIKTIKMQENIIKLNEFCKKKLEKQGMKKRNATIQINSDDQEDKKELSKISGRKIMFDNLDFKKTINPKINDKLDQTMDKDDSSRLSTEFYEEYYRLINSIKKEQQEPNHKKSNISRMDISSQNITQKSIKNLLSSPGNNRSQSPKTQLSNTQNNIISPKQFHHKEKSITKKSKSKSNLKNQGVQEQQIMNILTTTANGGASSTNLLARQSKGQQKSTESLKNNLRAESAPLLQANQANSMKKKGSQQRKISPNRQRQEKEKSQKRQSKNGLYQAKQMQYLNDEAAKIQLFFRFHLYKKGFYNEKIDKVIDGVQNNYIDEDDEEFQTVKKFQSNDKEYETQVFQGQSQQLDLQRNDITNEQDQLPKEYTQSDINKHQDLSNEEDDEYDDENQQYDANNIIIINQQSSDQKKVVYMSNINSCSLPQSPKPEDPSSVGQSNQGQSINEIQKVFEYRPQSLLDQNRYFSHDLSNNDQVHQQISWKPSLQSNNSEIRIVDDKFKQALKEANQQEKQLPQIEETKVMGEYGMRMFTGSESLLREFKLNTPKQQSTAKKQELISSQTSLRQMASSHDSQPSVNIQHDSQNNQLKSVQNSKSSQPNDVNSHSSQSLFERNSFQQFTKQKLQQMMKNNEFMNLIEMREKALEYRQQKEKKFIKKMYKNKQYSPRTYSSKKEQLEKWVILEQEDIKKTKKQFQEEWQKTLQMIEDTQKNVDDMRLKMKIQIDNSSKNHNQFNTHSSRNSSSSYATISRQEPRKSILEMEEFQPLSQRSMRLSVGSYKKDDPNNKSSHMVEQRRLLDSQTKSQNTINIEDQQKEEVKEENLIDYLEQSWMKNKQDQKQQQPSQRPSGLSRQGIYIEDQNRKINLSELSDNTPEKQQVPIGSNNQKQNQQIQNINQFKFQIADQNDISDDRPLTRSRSEQDLSDLLKKNKINFNDLDFNVLNDPNNKHLIQQQDLDSYRFVPLNNSKDKNEIKIQENLFEDSSNRYSKGKNYYQDHELNDLQSNDSLLNESELNNYFQDQKFSIEDFKSLDKRKILNQHSHFEDEDELLERNDSQNKLPQDDSLGKVDEYINNNSASQLFQPNESQIRIKNDVGDSEPSFIDSRRMFDRDQENRMLTPDIPQSSAFLHHQQALLFQNAKPGENIKISDILKKNLSMNDPNSSNSFLLAQDTSQILFQNAQINQSMVTPQLQPLIQNDYNNLANQLTEEILQTLLQQMISIPKREILQSQENISNIQQEQQQLQQQQLQQQQQQQQQSLLQPTIINQQQQLDPAHDVFLIDAQMNEKENRRESVEFRQRILIEQDLIRVENYINEVIQALQQAELQYLTTLAHNPSQIQTQESNYHRQFLQVLTTPIKKVELELLNQLQTSEIGSYEHFETAMDLNQNPILPIDLYLDIERQREESQIKTMYQNGVYDVDLESSVLQESTHIHNKSIFDSLNESLMKFRPYGMQGEPMPWSNKNRRLQTKVDTNSVDTERLFYMVKQDVMRWAQTFSGCSPSPIFLFRRAQDDSEQFDDELFQETRERRLAQMLATEVVENEHQWLNYEFEEAQVKIDLSDMILEHLVEEVALFLNFKHGSVIQIE